MARPTDLDRDDILARIAGCADAGEATRRGLLFHGTTERFDLPPRGGGYDGIVWTADTPIVAQAYIPRAGISQLLHHPGRWRLGERVVPNPDGAWTLVARQMTGLEPDVELDAHRRLVSWGLPPGWPTYGEAAEWLAGIGHPVAEDGSVWLPQDGAGGRIMPGDWRLPGRLLVTIGDGLDLADLRRGDEGDLTAVEYHDHAGFAAARAAGRDGVKINDFAQSERWGNVGHVSHGIFPEVAARLPWVEVPAVRHEWMASLAERVTPAFEALHAEARASAAPAPR